MKQQKLLIITIVNQAYQAWRQKHIDAGEKYWTCDDWNEFLEKYIDNYIYQYYNFD